MDVTKLRNSYTLLAEIREVLSDITDEFFSQVSGDNSSPSATVRVVTALMICVITTLADVLELAKTKRVRSVSALSRVAYETAVNAAFILASPEEVSAKAMRHADQKALRDLSRIIQIGSEKFQIQYSRADEILEHENSRALLEEFTTSAGREDRRWTDHSLEERIVSVFERFGRKPSIGFVFGMILYRQSSEVIHGTYYSVGYSSGRFDPNYEGVDGVLQYGSDQTSHLLTLLSFTCISLIECASSYLGEPSYQTRASEAYREYNRRSELFLDHLSGRFARLNRITKV